MEHAPELYEHIVYEEYMKPGVVVHAFNPSTQEAEAGGFLSSRPAWSTKFVPGQPELYRETMSQRKKKERKRKKENDDTPNPNNGIQWKQY